MQSPPRRRNDGFTLVEAMVSVAAGAVLALAAYAMWTMTARQNVAARARAESSSTAFAVVQRVEQEILRAQRIEVPDPDYPTEPSIQMTVNTESALVRRAFRLDEGQLVVDMKDERDEPSRVFEGIGELEFTVLDPPTNSAVAIDCTVNINGQQSVLRSAAKKRN